MPKTWEKVHGMADEYERLMREITRVYELALAKGIPAEDARFVLPNATPTNFQVMVNFAELLHIADLRLCWRAQWEIRHMVALMRREVVKSVPEIGGYLQPKCGEKRMGYCDEPLAEWEKCPLGKVRPHKEARPRSRPRRAPGPRSAALVLAATWYPRRRRAPGRPARDGERRAPARAPGD